MKIQKFGLRLIINFDFELVKTANVTGLNSCIENDDRHILMWDFDNVSIALIMNELNKIQKQWALPKIYINESSKGNYHAICFKPLPYPIVLNILASTAGLDEAFLKLGVVRGYFTLRITPKNGKKKIKRVAILNSDVEESLYIIEKLNLSDYTTKE